MAGKGRAGSHEIASVVRGAFLRASKQSEEDGRPLSTIILEQLQERPLECLRTISQFIPKEMLVEGEIKHVHEDMNDAELRAYANQLGKDLGISISVEGTQETTH